MSVRVWGERTRVLGLPRVASATQEMLHPVEGTVAGPPVRRAGAFECGPGDAEVRGVRSGDRTGVAGLPREASATQNGRVRRDWANRRSGAPGLCRVGCVASCGRCPEWRPDTKTSCTEGLGQPPNRRAGAFGLGNSREKVRKGRPDERGGAPEGGPVETQTCCVRKDLQSNDYLVDPASNHMLVSKIKPCMSKYMPK
ncbi:hypothetical protein HPB50_028907 [Hyalomma asiaticum]|nr:hypothetical protein HPB50_029362 [Hyalomma asiaticum]KAH6919786.1 hypothetical protein HPB50_029229 [Hyalomma asiaticum]KAH6920106.1 hypothetical protein HPB50_028907 [Hyalomma asiaticum]